MVAAKRAGSVVSRCACGAKYAEAAWLRLQLYECLSADEVSRLVLDWPATQLIEVRMCSRCGALLPTRRTSARP
jgi:hypothetical protein